MSRDVSEIITLDPSVDTAIYAAGDLICEKLTLTNAVRSDYGTGLLVSIVVIDLAKQNAELDFIFFDADPSGTTFTENAALTVADADADKIIAKATVLATDYTDFAASSVAVIGNIGQVIKNNENNKEDLYLAVLTQGTPDYVAAGDLRIRIGILQD